MFGTRRLHRMCSNILENVFALGHRSIDLFLLARAGCTRSPLSLPTEQVHANTATTCQHHLFIVFSLSLSHFLLTSQILSTKKKNSANSVKNIYLLPRKITISFAKHRVYPRLATNRHLRDEISIHRITILKM